MYEKNLLSDEIRKELRQVFDLQEKRVRIYDEFDVRFKEYLLDAPDFNSVKLESMCKETAEEMNSISRQIIQIKLNFSPQVYNSPNLFEFVDKLQNLEQLKFKNTLEYYVTEQQRLEKLNTTDELEFEFREKLNRFKKE